jgi:hypothetical protein
LREHPKSAAASLPLMELFVRPAARLRSAEFAAEREERLDRER